MEKYLVSVAIKKATYTAVKAVVAFAISAKATALETKFGIKIDTQAFEVAVLGAVFGLEHDLHMWLKTKYPNLSWL